ncbi:MAG TPA: glycosyltransferase family 2 protein [Flavobacteriaceae bacterium]|nr:glycosyltransferase family 2 protein [Flavobacteriaceae bacterium]HIO00198.1 glycosyltransferase family 2 protein [Flavobacteriaceae bacterium]
MKKKVFVIIVSYNGEKWLEKNLSSLKNSIYPVKTIVVDNNSSDASSEIIRSFQDVQLINSKENLGFGLANNLAMKEALSKDADYLFLLNQDTWVFPETIGNLVSAAEEYNNFGILSPLHYSGNEVVLDESFETYWNRKIQTFDGKIDEVPFVNAAAWLIPRRVVEKVGYFEPLYRHYGEDRNYATRVLFHNFKIGIVTNANICHDRVIKRNFKKDVTQSKYKILTEVLNINNSIVVGYTQGLINVFGLPKYFYKHYSIALVTQLFFKLIWYYLSLLFSVNMISNKRLSHKNDRF